MLLALALMLLGMQDPNPTLLAWQAAISGAQDMEATVGRLVGTEGRVVLCTLDGSVTSLRCFHSVRTTAANGHVTIAHSQPAEYVLDADTPLADVLAAETAWSVGATHPLHLRPQYRE